MSGLPDRGRCAVAQMTRRPGISEATLTALDIRHVSEDEAFNLLGQRYSGLYIPYRVNVEGKPFGRLRLDQPQDGRKYTQRINTGVHPYIPSLTGLEAQDDLVIVEGEFKAISLCEAGFRAVGISGFYGFEHEGQLCLRLKKHLKEHPARRILFVGDNDTALNFQFSDAAMKLARLVDPAPLALPRIPLSVPKGADDCREKLGEGFPAWWTSVVASSVSVPPKLPADLLAVELFKLAVADLKMFSGVEWAQVLQKISKLASHLKPLARGGLAKLCKAEFGIAKSDLGQAAVLAMEKKDHKFTSKEPSVSALLNSSKPKVGLPCDGRLLSTFAAELAEILKGRGMYQRGGLPFVVNSQHDGLDIVTAQMLRTFAEEHLVCFRIRRAGETELSLDRTMSEGDAKGVLCSQQFLNRLPNLERIATARLPVIRQNGEIELLPAGYDAESLILTVPQCEYDEGMPLSEARKVIDGLLEEFPFADAKRSKAVAVSAMVSLFAVGLLPKAALRPAFVYLANAEGAGKTILAKCAISPVHGFVDTEGSPKDKAEIAKELLTAVIEARTYILLDNCKGHVDSSQLEAFLTAVRWKGRVLGVSKSFCGENNVTVFITGNSCTVSPDVRRRSLFIELFMEDERAEDRKFSRTLDDAALLGMRAGVLAALWAFVREWDAAGRPKPSRSHSSFPRWAEITGGIVEFAGYGCPLETAEIESAADTDGADMRELVNLLGVVQAPVKFDELVAVARQHGLFERIIGSEDALKASEKSAFGKLLKRFDRRVFAAGRRFLVDGKGHSRKFHVKTEAGTHGQHGQHGTKPSWKKHFFQNDQKTMQTMRPCTLGTVTRRTRLSL